MATYNGEEYITAQLKSILRNFDGDFEIVISDDGSSDDTRSILESFKSKTPQMRIIDGPREGVIKNFENAIEHSCGDYIFLSDQDDVWADDKVETVMREFVDSRCLLVMHDAQLIDSAERFTGSTLYSLRKSRSGMAKNLVKNSYVGCCMAFRSSLKAKILPIPDGIEMHDWWIGLVAELEGETRFISDELIKYRRHGDNVSSMSHYPLPRMISNRLKLIKELAKRRAVRANAN